MTSTVSVGVQTAPTDDDDDAIENQDPATLLYHHPHGQSGPHRRRRRRLTKRLKVGLRGKTFPTHSTLLRPSAMSGWDLRRWLAGSCVLFCDYCGNRHRGRDAFVAHIKQLSLG